MIIRSLVILILFIFLASCSGTKNNSSNSDNSVTNEQNVSVERRTGGGNMERLTKELNLSERQKKQMRTIHDKYAEKFNAVRVSAGGQELKRTQMLELHENRNEEIKTVLNGEQYTKYEEMQKERIERMERRNAGGRGMPRGR